MCIFHSIKQLENIFGILASSNSAEMYSIFDHFEWKVFFYLFHFNPERRLRHPIMIHWLSSAWRFVDFFLHSFTPPFICGDFICPPFLTFTRSSFVKNTYSTCCFYWHFISFSHIFLFLFASQLEEMLNACDFLRTRYRLLFSWVEREHHRLEVCRSLITLSSHWCVDSLSWHLL